MLTKAILIVWFRGQETVIIINVKNMCCRNHDILIQKFRERKKEKKEGRNTSI